MGAHFKRKAQPVEGRPISMEPRWRAAIERRIQCCSISNSKIDNYNSGDDELFIFGFSRGAYTAPSLSGFIEKCGIISIGAPFSVKQLYDRYRRASAAANGPRVAGRTKAGRKDFDLEER
jgi:T6SS, Phospholipase effector Tle1-like, catalytic domain